MNEPGVKADAGKPQLTLLFTKHLFPAMVAVVRVIEYGAKKYPGIENWIRVPDGAQRYRDAAMRHLAQRSAGATLDESGLKHMAHAACSVLFALALEIMEDEKNDQA